MRTIIIVVIITCFSVIIVVLQTCNGGQNRQSIDSVLEIDTNTVNKYQSSVVLLLRYNIICMQDDVSPNRQLIYVLSNDPSLYLESQKLIGNLNILGWSQSYRFANPFFHCT